jgi:hypothetical protein
MKAQASASGRVLDHYRALSSSRALSRLNSSSGPNSSLNDGSELSSHYRKMARSHGRRLVAAGRLSCHSTNLSSATATAASNVASVRASVKASSPTAQPAFGHRCPVLVAIVIWHRLRRASQRHARRIVLGRLPATGDRIQELSTNQRGSTATMSAGDRPVNHLEG